MAATCTGQIIVGSTPSEMGSWLGPDDGIGPQSVMYLVEGTRAMWVLETVGHTAPTDEIKKPVSWIPSRLECILPDALVMIATLVEQDSAVLETIDKSLGSNMASLLRQGKYVDLTEIDEAQLRVIQALAAEAVRSKLVITALRSSSLIGQVALVERWQMEVEVCTPTWTRERGAEGKQLVEGALPPEDEYMREFNAGKT